MSDERLKSLEEFKTRIGNEVRINSSDLSTHMKIEEIQLKQINATVAKILKSFEEQTIKAELTTKEQNDRTDKFISKCYEDMKESLKMHPTTAEMQVKNDEVVFLMRSEMTTCANSLKKDIADDITKQLKTAKWGFGLALALLLAGSSLVKYLMEHWK